MLEKIIAFSLKNKLIVLLFTLGIFGFGLFSIFQISIGAVPDITNNQVQVITTSANLSTQDIEQYITYPVEIELANFLQDENSGIFVLESMEVQSRDNWMKYLITEATNFGIPQIELWAHSARICKKITDRTRIQTDSIYKAIYGGIN